MNETEYHRLADTTLAKLAEGLEPSFEAGTLEELELTDGILTIELGGQTLIINKHVASREIWLASPSAGGLHFAHKNNGWELADGRTLTSVLSGELSKLGVSL